MFTGFGFCRVWRDSILAIGIVTACAAVSGPAANAQSLNWDRCMGYGGPTSDERIGACTAILTSATEPPGSLAKAHGYRGVAHVNRREHGLALRDYEEALRLDSESAFSYRIRGNKYRLEGDDERALVAYDQAIRLDPRDALAFSNRGAVYIDRRTPDRAIPEYSRAIELDPKLSAAYMGRAAAYRLKGQYPLAIADYDQAIQLGGNSAMARSGRGNAYLAQKNYAHALADFDEAIRLDPKYPNAYGNRAYLRLRAGEIDQAISDFDVVLAADPNNGWWLYGRGLARQQKGDGIDGDADVATARRTNPGVARAAATFYGIVTSVR